MYHLNLDNNTEKAVITLGGEDYELILPTLGNQEEYLELINTVPKIKPSKEDKTGNKQLKKVLKKFFIKPPTDAVLDEIDVIQLKELWQFILTLHTTEADASEYKKKDDK